MNRKLILLRSPVQAFLLGPALLSLVSLFPKPVSAGAPDLDTIRVASGLFRPVFVTTPPGESDRLFIVEQSGRIRVFLNGVPLTTPFLDISARVSNIGTSFTERGLLGLAFHPDYVNNGYFYVNYTAAPGVAQNNHATVVARFSVSQNPNGADPDSETVILEIEQPFSTHNGGMIAFGADGYLYIGTGDGGHPNDPLDNAQDLNSLLGKMLRIDVNGDDFPQDSRRNYAIPAGNPFANDDGAEEIWAYGLRNPWRFSFDRSTDDLYIADVGQGSLEEISFQDAASTGGENYGWRCMEGTECTNNDGCPCNLAAQVDPIHEYGRSDGCSITGGYVYRGCAMPGLVGTYFFADWCNGRIWSFRYDGNQKIEFTERTNELDPGNGLDIEQVSSFGEDGRGEIYIVNYGSTSAPTGEVFKIVPGGGVPDADGDLSPDACDDCPNDETKTSPGVCGCGVSDWDADNDGRPACADACPNDPAKFDPGVCGCGARDADDDGDGDGIVDCPNPIGPGCGGCGALGLAAWPMSILSYAGILLHRRRRTRRRGRAQHRGRAIRGVAGRRG